jgi:hypothetical protein
MAAIICVALPLWSISKWFIPFQLVLGIYSLSMAMRLFATWPEKKRMVNILIVRNHETFHPASFEPYMKAPCGRMVVRVVLKRINMETEIKNLKKYRISFRYMLTNNCKNVETKITYGDYKP